MGIITNMRNRMQIVMWTILVLFVISMAIGGLVGGASIGDIFGQQKKKGEKCEHMHILKLLRF